MTGCKEEVFLVVFLFVCFVFFNAKGGETLVQVAQGGDGCLMPGDIQGQVG